MPSSTSNLGLTIWNQSGDWFDFTQLATNFSLIDAQFSPVSVLSTPVKLIQSGTSLPTNPVDGQLFYLTTAASGFTGETLLQYRNVQWTIVGNPEIVTATPASNNFKGRTVVFSAASGSYNTGDIATYNGSTWVKVGGVATYATVSAAVAASPTAGQLAVLSAADNTLGAGGPYSSYSLMVYNSSLSKFQPIAGVPAGVIEMYAGSSVPAGWLLCDGNTYNITDYPNLFTAIGYNYGSSGATFNVPDMKGRVPVGVGTNATVNTLNKNDGLGVGSRQPKHSHTVTDAGHTHTASVTDPGHNHTYTVNSDGSTSATGNTGPNVITDHAITNNIATSTNTTSITVANATGTTGIAVGSGFASGDGPSFITVNYIIKV